MVHKLRKAMGNRDALYTLEDMIELDEGYFTVESSDIEQSKGIKGRGATSKQNVLIMAESTPLEELKKGKQENYIRYFKAKVLDTHLSDENIKASLDDQCIVFTDKISSYVDISDFVALHISEKSTKETTEKTLKWAHIAISNAKRNLLGDHHKIKSKYLQLYLNEFLYKLNRRFFGKNYLIG